MIGFKPMVVAATVSVAALLVAATPAHAQGREQGVSRLAVIVDASDSFVQRFPEAMERATVILESMAGREVRRWETATDEVVVISLDALPAVIWRGPAAELRGQSSAAWAERLGSRGDFASCTDVEAAFRLAIRELGRGASPSDPRLLAKYILAFTDLISEPPTTTLARCAAASNPSPPPVGFPWQELTGVSVSVLWVPSSQMLAWHRAAEAAGLEETFRIFSDSESGNVALVAPAPLLVVATDAELAELRAKVVGGGKRLLRAALWAALGLFILLVTIVFIGRRRAAPSIRRAPVNSTDRR